MQASVNRQVLHVHLPTCCNQNTIMVRSLTIQKIKLSAYFWTTEHLPLTENHEHEKQLTKFRASQYLPYIILNHQTTSLKHSQIILACYTRQTHSSTSNPKTSHHRPATLVARLFPLRNTTNTTKPPAPTPSALRTSVHAVGGLQADAQDQRPDAVGIDGELSVAGGQEEVGDGGVATRIAVLGTRGPLSTEEEVNGRCVT